MTVRLECEIESPEVSAKLSNVANVPWTIAAAERGRASKEEENRLSDLRLSKPIECTGTLGVVRKRSLGKALGSQFCLARSAITRGACLSV